ncbi:hypothetical protein [Nocardia jiangxiensis]|uniref:hypothetical protein n=1 Tax=Nocardia jiangxiensis TaxID=282685 RepID=UPI0003096902|nr:hypothetical protein [Nocardia jiangxiensis]
MPRSTLAPLSAEARSLRSQLAYLSSQHADDSEEVQTARRRFLLQKFLDALALNAPYADWEYQLIIDTLEGSK